jgi:hypothetical protein
MNNIKIQVSDSFKMGESIQQSIEVDQPLFFESTQQSTQVYQPTTEIGQTTYSNVEHQLANVNVPTDVEHQSSQTTNVHRQTVSNNNRSQSKTFPVALKAHQNWYM